jgi:mono/diheme cytochrome c family protein
MWKRNATALALGAGLCGLLLSAAPAPLTAQQAPKPGLPTGPMKEKADKACLACHNSAIIVQQQLDRRVWVKDVEKMIRWGAPVAPEDREALIDYFAQHFAPREPEQELTLPDGPSVGKVRVACLVCHGTGNIAENRLDRRGWTQIISKMENWGAVVQARDREAILNYLVTHFSPPAEEPKKKDEKQ